MFESTFSRDTGSREFWRMSGLRRFDRLLPPGAPNDWKGSDTAGCLRGNTRESFVAGFGTRSCRFRESILSATFLGSPSAQPALVIALSERHTPRAQDVVCGDGVEIEVGQRKREDEGLRCEG
jgi:hypothetical protein